ncbi:hypothetical protein CPS_0519 [Colwellia psychrerythraea 34H]|uniref:Uncharacterized protein n=1 Tax=Colwellia psychrerythraea (strain 34H / ATCC BAA-681) TaxID=167879 RepID=Q489I7_COLP3|nr:hypothetical protein CPS_0519 [Colwellia psychrerythraea 34H]
MVGIITLKVVIEAALGVKIVDEKGRQVDSKCWVLIVLKSSENDFFITEILYLGIMTR